MDKPGSFATRLVVQFPWNSNMAKITNSELLSPELMAQNMEFLAKNFFMKGPIAVKTVKRNPVVLGNMLDCTRESGACEGDCNRCWARF